MSVRSKVIDIYVIPHEIGLHSKAITVLPRGQSSGQIKSSLGVMSTVVKSKVITINVQQAVQTIAVQAVYLDADKYTITTGESVTFSSYVGLASAPNKDTSISITLYATDPTGTTRNLGSKTATIRAGSQASNLVTWTVTLNTPGTWEFYAEAPDSIQV